MSGVVSPSALTANDEHLMNVLFDPGSSVSKRGAIIDSGLQALPDIEPQQLQALRAREALIIKPLDSQDPLREAVENAIVQLTELLDTNPAYPSAYMNRAQARRLLISQSNHTFHETSVRNVQLVLSDLTKTIELAAPTSPSAPVSSFQAELLSKAYTHRAYVMHMMSKPGNPSGIVQRLSGGGGVQTLEDMASRDFFMGGIYGDAIAKEMAVATNPYAKMCGAIVKEALKQEISHSLDSRGKDL
ncbi:uncharacterized protein DNG_08088 [Cephalotrichum gorgonifer]|uniref:Uncharacterized protein n=1 Tax=Cephalotrichum gorgonifer TaxID=2041049 RepID=A0AAE8SY08_9PEZI|nr:uncharacterized protein DNG_08088 [Cephalotrichum gorgonifer]